MYEGSFSHSVSANEYLHLARASYVVCRSGPSGPSGMQLITVSCVGGFSDIMRRLKMVSSIHSELTRWRLSVIRVPRENFFHCREKQETIPLLRSSPPGPYPYTVEPFFFCPSISTAAGSLSSPLPLHFLKPLARSPSRNMWSISSTLLPFISGT